MTRLRSLGVAFAALALSATAVAAFTLPSLPDAASNGLDVATDKADKDLPARPAIAPPDITTQSVDAADLPDAASHGSDVSAVATADDPTPDTNTGADVSAVAKDNHGQPTAAEHRPTDVGKPDAARAPDVPASRMGRASLLIPVSPPIRALPTGLVSPRASRRSASPPYRRRRARRRATPRPPPSCHPARSGGPSRLWTATSSRGRTSRPVGKTPCKRRSPRAIKRIPA
jgi:hypothetical protein